MSHEKVANVLCPYCGKSTKLRPAMEVYHSPCYAGKLLYICRPCKALVGCHPGTTIPLGLPANRELRQWRRKAHLVFDALWKRKLEIRRRQRGPEYKKVYARGSGYKWLCKHLGIARKDCHIGMFDIETCKRVVELCTNWRKYRDKKENVRTAHESARS